MQSKRSMEFEAVCEADDFLSLFPHRFDYIWAEHPAVGEAVEWRTESRYPLSDRLIQQGSYLYGVRFGSETAYALLDIDMSSAYHPQKDPFAITRIVAALEPLGLVDPVACTSSYSGGLHLYFPFQQSQSSWQVAIVIGSLLENSGFKLQPGQLEIFPNPKAFAADGNYSLFNAHRLPLQMGSYLLNKTWQPIWSDRPTFVRQWQFVQERNILDRTVLKRLLKQVKRKHYGISGKAEKFINDLNAEIELGWTGEGQTNRLLGRITMRSYIFHHVLSGSEPLSGQALVNEIVQTARALPGYQEWCRHQHEIEHRAKEWAHCIENSRYFHFGYGNSKAQKINLDLQDPDLVEAIDQSPSWNQQQSASARDRIRGAIADLLEKAALPVRPTARFQALLQYGIGGGSLYRHRDLWHPNYFDMQLNDFQRNGVLSTEVSLTNDQPDETEEIQEQSASQSVENQFTENQSVENPPHPPLIIQNSQLDRWSEASNWLCSPSLFPTDGGNVSQGRASGDRSPTNAQLSDRNSPVRSTSEGLDYIRQVLSQVQEYQEGHREGHQEAYRQARQIAHQHHQQQRSQSEAQRQRQRDRMQQYLASGDPILMAEARAWLEIAGEG